MRHRNSTSIISIVTGGAACAVIFLSSWSFAPPVDRKLHSEIGRALARETLSLLRAGGQITLITRDTEVFPQPALDILSESFEQEIRRAGDFPVGIQTIQLDPLRPVEVPPGDFYELLRRSPADRVIVSLLGPPVLTREQRGALGRVKPKVIAFCSGHLSETLDLKELFNAGLLHAALTLRPSSPSAGDTAAGRSSTFERFYTIMRADLTTAQEPLRGGVPPLKP